MRSPSQTEEAARQKGKGGATRRRPSHSLPLVSRTPPPYDHVSYCHVYGEGELPELVASTPGLRLVETFYDTSNWCVIAEKIEAGGAS